VVRARATTCQSSCLRLPASGGLANSCCLSTVCQVILIGDLKDLTGLGWSNIEGLPVVPKIEECYALMDEFRMLGNIRDHSIIVARVAELMATGLLKAGVSISLEKTIAGALLHDIGKTICLYQGGDHAQLGREICLRRNLYEVADIVGEHVRLREFRPEGGVSEKEIVYYADKRVNHNAVVTLAERVQYIIDRYGGNDREVCRRIRANFIQCELVERKLFARLDYSPKDIGMMLAGRETVVTPLSIGCSRAGRY